MNRFELIKEYKQTSNECFFNEYYNHKEYAAIHSKPKRKWLLKANLLAMLMDVKPGAKLLDVGCAGKLLKPVIEQRGGLYFSMDIATHFRPDFLCNAVDLISFPKNEYQWIVLSDILEHLPTPDVVIKGALHAGKRVIIVVPHLYRLEAFSKLLSTAPEDRHLHKQSVIAWEKCIRLCEGHLDESIGFFFIPSLCWDIRRKRMLNFDKWLRSLSFLQRLNNKLQTRAIHLPWLKYFAQEVIIICRRRISKD